MKRLAVVLALVNTTLLGAIAVELYPIAQAARLAVAIATEVAVQREARQTETDEERRARVGAAAAEMVDSFNAGLEAARRSAQRPRPSRPQPAP